MFFFTADEHHGHNNIIKHLERPFKNIKEMEEELIKRHNEVVTKRDTVIHSGDFCIRNKQYTQAIIKRLNGTHVFLKGNHDYWLERKAITIWERNIDKNYIVVCHYCMRTWPKSHYGSWQLFGHSHGKLKDYFPTQMDIGVDTNNYYPYSFEEIKKIINNQILIDLKNKKNS